jgi:hypothetical protein
MPPAKAIVSDGRLFAFDPSEVGPLIYRRKVKKDGGPNLLRDRKMVFPAQTPVKCLGCTYGQWMGSVHYCPWVKCVRGGGSDAVIKP